MPAPTTARSTIKLNPSFSTFQRRYLSRSRLRHGPKDSSSPLPTQTRIDRIIHRLPRFLQSYLLPLRHAPVSHVSSFLILHELTALVPLIGLTAVFHYFEWIPSALRDGRHVREAVERFERYFRRRGWIEDEPGPHLTRAPGSQEANAEANAVAGWGKGGVGIVLECATAYAITKVLLPARLLGSVWATPWFARAVLGPVLKGVKRVVGR
ncbi:MAG: hypothetical protein M1826_002779 [Phylliscum demangeonii]|nr:MAG: hypothetical protein M1826_002779 [Phylliscum demangeonii]